MPVWRAAFEFLVPAVHRVLVHTGRLQHLNPHLFIYAPGSFARSHFVEHAGQQPLLALQLPETDSNLLAARLRG